MESILIIIYVLVIFRGTIYIKNLIKALFQFYKQELVSLSGKEKNIELDILIPLYLEQKTIDKMLQYFADMPHHDSQRIFFITTQREGQDVDSTYHVLNKTINDKYLKLKGRYFNIIHYPFEKGVMSHQLNYAYNFLNKKISDKEKANSYVCVYNADSEPLSETFTYFNTISQSLDPVYQQVATFLQNYLSYNQNFITKNILKASAITQTRWSLGYEINMYNNQSRFWSVSANHADSFFNNLKEPFVYCVGHGLFIRKDILEKVGLFPDDTMNEDLPLGYYLNLNRIPIKLFPLLESADNPNTLRDLINQKSSWFWGMIDYLKYMKIARRKFPNVSKNRSWIYAIKGYLNGSIYWSTASLIAFILLLAPIYINTLLPYLFIAFVMYFVIPINLTIFFYNRFYSNVESKRIPNYDYILMPLFSYFYILISSFGAWKTIAMIIKRSILGSELIKYKTPR